MSVRGTMDFGVHTTHSKAAALWLRTAKLTLEWFSTDTGSINDEEGRSVVNLYIFYAHPIIEKLRRELHPDGVLRSSVSNRHPKGNYAGTGCYAYAPKANKRYLQELIAAVYDPVAAAELALKGEIFTDGTAADDRTVLTEVYSNDFKAAAQVIKALTDSYGHGPDVGRIRIQDVDQSPFFDEQFERLAAAGLVGRL